MRIIQYEEWNAFIEKFGPIIASQFFQIYNKGSGDYTKEQHTWFSDNPDKKLHLIFKATEGI